MFFAKKTDTSEFFNLAPDIMLILSKDLRVKSANKAFLTLTGFLSEEIQNNKLTDIVYGDDRSVTETSLSQLVEDKDQVEISNRILSKSKNALWLKWVFTVKGNSIFAVAIDKTNDQAAQNVLIKQNREIEEERAKINAMLSNIGDGVIGTTDKGNIYFLNKSAEDLLNVKIDSVLGKIFLQEIQTVDDRGNPIDTNKHPLRNAMLTRRVIYSREFSLKKSDGNLIPVSITASPVILRGNIIGGIIIFRDITKEREIDRMKTEFISLASHQLRTPLSAMRWFSEMLLDGDIGELSPEQKEVITNINKSNQRMIELVNSLLNISRIESGRMVVEPEPTNIKELVDEVILELQPKIQEKKHSLAVSVHGSLPLINIDPRLVRHVYMNLLTNAIKYTPEGGQIIVLISQSDQDIISQVSDNGLGIPKKQQDRLFQKFFRAENVVRVVTDGTGLGLYLVKAIVEASGGKIWFQSEEGKGTSFWFSLPLSGSKPNKGEVSIDS